jgi:hypothetical protein
MMIGWLRRNWWMILAVLAGPVLTVFTLLLVRWLRMEDSPAKQLSSGDEL